MFAAFYVGGAIGFRFGFHAGTNLTRIGIGRNVVAALQTPTNEKWPNGGAPYLESIVDDAIDSYEMRQRFGDSLFDTIGVDALDAKIDETMEAILEYRRANPSPFSDANVHGTGRRKPAALSPSPN